MKPVLFLTADYANQSSGGKLNVMGIFNVIYAHQFPARHPSMFIVAKLMPELGEYGITRDIFIMLHGPNGEEILKIGAPTEVPQPSGTRKPEIIIIINLNDVVFSTPGPYQFILMVDRDYKTESTLYVEEQPTPLLSSPTK